MRHGVLCRGADVGLCSVSASNATACPARLHARPRLCGRANLFLLAWSRIRCRVWHWVWGGVLGRAAGILWIWRTVRSAWVWLVRWIWRLRRAFARRCSRAASDTPVSCASAVQEKILKNILLFMHDADEVFCSSLDTLRCLGESQWVFGRSSIDAFNGHSVYPIQYCCICFDKVVILRLPTP